MMFNPLEQLNGSMRSIVLFEKLFGKDAYQEILGEIESASVGEKNLLNVISLIQVVNLVAGSGKLEELKALFKSKANQDEVILWVQTNVDQDVLKANVQAAYQQTVSRATSHDSN